MIRDEHTMKLTSTQKIEAVKKSFDCNFWETPDILYV